MSTCIYLYDLHYLVVLSLHPLSFHLQPKHSPTQTLLLPLKPIIIFVLEASNLIIIPIIIWFSLLLEAYPHEHAS